jgi:hypothetical protein
VLWYVTRQAACHLLSPTVAMILPCSLHGGAKAGQKHERVALTPQQEAAQCDICQVCAAAAHTADAPCKEFTQ